jgi:enterochelin esterase-like enzyme
MNIVEQQQSPGLWVEEGSLHSGMLHRTVWYHVYRPETLPQDGVSLLLLYDGQELMPTAFFQNLSALQEAGLLQPLLIVAVHAGPHRLLEYGTAGIPDYAGRGVRAGLHHRFILEELIPSIQHRYGINSFGQMAAAGFSLGGLAALSLVWSHPKDFSVAGVFSGSLWWRSKALDNGYDEDRDRIMHQLVRSGTYQPGLKFYFTTGSLDETADRNGNGIIDSIDDTLALITELKAIGYTAEEIFYTNYEDGRHDMETWVRVLPAFLLWGWRKK